MGKTEPSENERYMGRVEERAGELRERLAAIEHERWADWQRYCHSKGTPVPKSGGLYFASEVIERWERQIDTPYERLSAGEKASDMEQVDRYWPLIEPLLEAEQRLLAIEETQEAPPAMKTSGGSEERCAAEGN